jgi:transcriptional regulator with XRE-family HTH domain
MQEINPLSGPRDAVATAIRLALAAEKKSGRALAEEIGMPQSNFSRRMAGEVAFSIDELAAIAAKLNMPLAELVATAGAA